MLEQNHPNDRDWFTLVQTLSNMSLYLKDGLQHINETLKAIENKLDRGDDSEKS